MREGERKSESVDLNDLVRSTLALTHNELISRGIEVKTDLASGLPATLGDPVQLQQLLLNLLMNAMDAMTSTPDAHRLITVRTRMAFRFNSGPAIPNMHLNSVVRRSSDKLQ